MKLEYTLDTTEIPELWTYIIDTYGDDGIANGSYCEIDMDEVKEDNAELWDIIWNKWLDLDNDYKMPNSFLVKIWW